MAGMAVWHRDGRQDLIHVLGEAADNPNYYRVRLDDGNVVFAPKRDVTLSIVRVGPDHGCDAATRPGNCPRCHLALGWNGQRCNHCKFVTAVKTTGEVAKAATLVGGAITALGLAGGSSAAVGQAAPAAQAVSGGADGDIMDALGEVFEAVLRRLLGGG